MKFRDGFLYDGEGGGGGGTGEPVEPEAPAGGEGGEQNEALAKAQQELAEARKEADDAKKEADSAKLTAAGERIASLEGQVTDLEKQAADAAKAKNADGSKKYSQEYVDKLRNEAAKRRTDLQSERDVRKQLEDEHKTELQRRDERATTAEGRAEKAEHSLRQIQAAIAKELPLELAPRLVGETQEELEADAEGLKGQVRPSTGHGLDQGARSSSQQRPGDMNDWMRRQAGVAR